MGGIQTQKHYSSIGGIRVVDLVAETTDGGKISVKKRVKKYNLIKNVCMVEDNEEYDI